MKLPTWKSRPIIRMAKTMRRSASSCAIGDRAWTPSMPTVFFSSSSGRWAGKSKGPARLYGRKKTLQVVSIFFIVAAVGCASVSAWILFIFFRIVGGLAVGASSVIAPMYISEIAPAGLRGRLAGSFQLNIVAGIFIAYLTNFAFSGIGPEAWRW